MIFNRIYLGEISPLAMRRIMSVIRDEYRDDSLTWYVVEETNVGGDDHPCNPGHRWDCVEADLDEEGVVWAKYEQTGVTP